MTVQLLQGINAQNPGSIVKIFLENDISDDLIQEILDIHPVIGTEFKKSGNEITITTSLPFLWQEIGECITLLSKKSWSYDYTKEYIHKTILSKRIFSLSTISVLWNAIQQKLEITPYYTKELIVEEGEGKYNQYYVLGVGKESAIVNGISSSSDSNYANQIQGNKWITNTVIDRLGLPTAKWQRIKSTDDIKENWEQYKKPIVIKRSFGSRGIGVVTNINTLEQAYKAYNLNLDILNQKPREKKNTSIIMQEQASGEDYRILVINNKFAVATKRVPAFVIGNGKNTIEELIEEINKDPKRDISKMTHTLKPIVIDDMMMDFLQDQGRSIKDIPKSGEQVFVRKVASVSQGGNTEDVTDLVHSQIKKIVETLSSSIHAYVIGVDILCKDITKPLTEENGIIIECNTKPEAYLNIYPSIGKTRESAMQTFLNGLISKNRTKRIVYIGGDTKDVQTHLKTIVEEKESIGMYSNNKMYLDDNIINDNIDFTESIGSLKRNKTISTCVFHISEEEFEKHGSGFEEIDLLVLSSDIDENIKKTMKGYSNLGHIFGIKEF